MKLTFLILISLAVTVSNAFNSCGFTGDNGRLTGLERTVSIKEIRTRQVGPGIYSIQGVVIEHYFCPPCNLSPLIGCEPCRRGNSVLVSVENKSLDDYYNLSENEILLHTDNPKSFEHGKKYLFKVEVTDKKLSNEPGLDLIEISDYKQL